MSAAIQFVGTPSTDGSIAVWINLRGKDVGYVTLDLDQWDQLRDDVRGMNQGAWIEAVADATLQKARA